MEKLLLKIEHSEITPFFYNNFFHFGGRGGTFHVFPLAAPMIYWDIGSHVKDMKSKDANAIDGKGGEN